MTRTAFKPDLKTFHSIEEQALSARLEATRAVLAHAGEKGIALEGEVSKLLRSFLPAEYGLSSGFIVYKSGGPPLISSQLDIIIYDALRCGPIARFETCDVLPLEAVYGYVEVKASICASNQDTPPKNSLEILRKAKCRTWKNES